MNSMKSRLPGHVRGATLVVSLMILLVLVILGLSASNVSIMQERMASSYMESHDAFQAAEDTIRAVERAMAAGGTGGLPPAQVWADDQNRLIHDCTLEERHRNDWDDNQFWEEAIWTAMPQTRGQFLRILIDGTACAPMQGASRPDDNEELQFYLIIARAQGFDTERSSNVVLQSIYVQ